MKPNLKQTGREKLGYIDGVNLFFGALLGANLGTLGAMPLTDYVVLIALLVALVMAIRTVSLSDRRLRALAMLAFCLAVFAAFLFVPGVQPEGFARSDLERLAATILVWVAVTTTVEFYPTGGDEDQAGA
ncbi:MAG TPA: hypothetical protein VJS15_02965 [Allosphingosinicella sp.]|nr:hypothetical protein [Allosphingosinicella sp.]